MSICLQLNYKWPMYGSRRTNHSFQRLLAWESDTYFNDFLHERRVIFAKNAYIHILYLTIYVSYSIWIIRYMNSIKRVRPFLVLMISRVILKRISEISNEWSHTMRQNELSIEFIDEYMYWVIHMIHSRWRIRFFVLHISALIQCSVEKEWYSNIAKR